MAVAGGYDRLLRGFRRGNFLTGAPDRAGVYDESIHIG
jgi:hypothetical protein